MQAFHFCRFWLFPCVMLLTNVTVPAADSNAPSAEVTKVETGGVRLLAAPVDLRSGGVREWDSFPEEVMLSRWEQQFSSQGNAEEWTLLWRQQDVKQEWHVLLNQQRLGTLIRDENDLWHQLAIPPELLRAGENTLVISPKSTAAMQSDDIRLMALELHRVPAAPRAQQCSLELTVLDEQTGEPLPARLTIVDSQGALAIIGTESSATLAVRSGVIYTADGRADLALPAGAYTVYAGRGFEYSVAKATLELKPESATSQVLRIRRVVPTAGYVAMDPHVHTVTFSGHGDATLAERFVTIAGEGIEVPVAADHNRNVDYRAELAKTKLGAWFTPVTGNEVTTRQGHFVVFPTTTQEPPPDHQRPSWKSTMEAIGQVSAADVVILNHARDLHSGVRPFAPERFRAATGELLVEEWPDRLTAMEVINSGATQSQPLQLLEDWMSLLNRGRAVTPIGSSDSHDVARHFVGQGRTYVRASDGNAGQIDLTEVRDSLRAGRVLVSYGLLADLRVNGQFTAGDIAQRSNVTAQSLRNLAHWNLELRVLGPEWVTADRVLLYENGELAQEFEIPADETMSRAERADGIIWQRKLDWPACGHDTFLTVIALGPGIQAPYWPTAKPYQPLNTNSMTSVLGCSGAVWLDNDHDGRATAARGYAERLCPIAKPRPTIVSLTKSLQGYDAAIAAQALALWQTAGGDLESDEYRQGLATAEPDVARGFQAYWQSWRDGELARTTR